MAEKIDRVFERALKIALSERAKSNERKGRALNIREREASTGERGQASLADFRINTTAITRARNATLKRQGRRQLRINERGATVGERTVGVKEETGRRKELERIQNSSIFKQLFPELSGGGATKGRGGATGSFDAARDLVRGNALGNLGSTLDDDLNLLRRGR